MQKFIHTNNSLKNLIFENEKYNLSNYKKFLINESDNQSQGNINLQEKIFSIYDQFYEEEKNNTEHYKMRVFMHLINEVLIKDIDFKIIDNFYQNINRNNQLLKFYYFISYICDNNILFVDNKGSICLNKQEVSFGEDKYKSFYEGIIFDDDLNLSDIYTEPQIQSIITEIQDTVVKNKNINKILETIKEQIQDFIRIKKNKNKKSLINVVSDFFLNYGNRILNFFNNKENSDDDTGDAKSDDDEGADDEGADAKSDDDDDTGDAKSDDDEGADDKGADDVTQFLYNPNIYDYLKEQLDDDINKNISLLDNSLLGRFFSKRKIDNDYIIKIISSKVIFNDGISKITIQYLFDDLLKYNIINDNVSYEINELIKNKLNEKYEQLKEKKIIRDKIITNDQFKKLLFDSISNIINLNENQIIYLFNNINELNENKITYKNLLIENKQKYSFNNIGKLIELSKIKYPQEQNIVIDLSGFKKLKKNQDKFDFLFDKISFRWDLFYRVAYAEVICKSILENKDELLKASLKIVGQLPDPGVQSKNASVVSSVLSSKIKTKLGKDKRDITDQDIQRELEESVADICLGILRMYDGETYNKYQKSIDDDIVAQYNQGGGWGFEKLFNIGDITKRVRHETTHKTSEQVKTRLLQQEVKKIIEAFIALTKTVKPDLQQDHKLFTGNIINENNLIYKQFKLLIEEQTDESQEETEEKETDESTEQETDDTKSDYKISVAKLKQVLQANGVLIYGKSAQNIDAKTRKESEHYMLEMFSSFLSINFDIEVTGVKKYKYDDLIRDQIIAAGNINTQPKEGQVSSERIQKLTQGSGLPTKIGDITLEQLVSLLNDAGKSDQLVRVLSAPKENQQEVIQQIVSETETKQQFLNARKGLPNLSKKITEILFKKENVVKIKTKLTGNYEFKDDKFNIDGLQRFFNIIDESILFDDKLKDNFIEFTKQFLKIIGSSHEKYDGFVRDEIGCNILNKVLKKASFSNKISTDFINKLKSCNNKAKLIKLVGDTFYGTKEEKSDGGVDIERTKTAIRKQFIEDTKLDDLTLEASKKMSSGLILREGVRVSSVDEVMREFGELKREFRNIYRY